MGKRGPKPKPTALKVLEGNPSRRPLNELEPSCDMPPVKPSVVTMDELASIEWDRVVAAMPPNLYTALDTTTLANYAMAWSMLVKAQNDIEENGLSVEIYEIGKDGAKVFTAIRTNPAVRVWKTASETLLKCADRLGLHPGARTRLEVPKRGAAPPQSKFAGYLGAT
jgi:P27 family predicted phage terminase small subunit